MDNIKIYKGCVIEIFGLEVCVFKNQTLVHREGKAYMGNISKVVSKVVTMIDEGEI